SYSYFVDLLKAYKIRQFCREVYQYTLSHGRRPPLLLRRYWNRSRANRTEATPFPPWLNPDLERRFALRDRWQSWWAGNSDSQATASQFLRAEAVTRLGSP